MAKVLYITAHPNDETQSFSMAAGKAFIDTYKEVNPNDEVVHIDLYKENIPTSIRMFSVDGENFNLVKDLKNFQQKKKQK